MSTTTKMSAVETTLAYTNAFGEDMRIPYSESEMWRAERPDYSDVRVESRHVVVEVTTSDWKPVA